jgi:hypothetical protein
LVAARAWSCAPTRIRHGGLKLDDREPGKIVYRIKTENVGRRKIIDLSFRARIYVRGFHLLPGARSTTWIIEVPVDPQHLFIFRPRNNRVIWLEVSGVADDCAAYLDEELLTSLAERRDGSLEALLRLSDDAYLVVQALAYDAWSGARKYYASKRYRASDIVRGPFKGLEVVESAAPETLEKGAPAVAAHSSRSEDAPSPLDIGPIHDED